MYPPWDAVGQTERILAMHESMQVAHGSFIFPTAHAMVFVVFPRSDWSPSGQVLVGWLTTKKMSFPTSRTSFFVSYSGWLAGWTGLGGEGPSSSKLVS